MCPSLLKSCQSVKISLCVLFLITEIALHLNDDPEEAVRGYTHVHILAKIRNLLYRKIGSFKFISVCGNGW